jgi:biotin transporter BioY
MAVVTYILAGTLGWLPFAGGTILGPTGGYLIGFFAATFSVGSLTVKVGVKSWWSKLVVLLVGNVIVYVFGLPWLSHFVGWRAALPLGFYPFIIGDLLKIVCALGIWQTFDQHS